jgi:hypothetical protein
MTTEQLKRSYHLFLHLVDPRDPFSLVSPIGTAIRWSYSRVEKAAQVEDKMTADSIIDDECDLIEGRLGLSFVAAQTGLTGIVSGCMRIHDFHEKQTGSRQLLGIDGKKKEILGLRNADIVPVDTTGHSQVEGVNAFANYFKHRDEWPHDWTQLENHNEKDTAEVIQAFGAKPGSTGNFRVGYERLFGDNDFTKVERIAEVVEKWASAIRKAYTEELRAKGLL